MTSGTGHGSAGFGMAHVSDELERGAHLLDDVAADTEGRPGTWRGAELSDLYAISREVVQFRTIDELAPRLLDFAMTMTTADRGVFLHSLPRSRQFEVCAARGFTVEGAAVLEQCSTTILEELWWREPVHLTDAWSEPRLADAPSVRMNEIRSVICVPIANARRVLGALYLDKRDPEQAFPAAAAHLVSIMASLAVPSLQGMELHEKRDNEATEGTGQSGGHSRFEELVGHSRPMRQLLSVLEHVSTTDFPVLLQGESGSGKELICRAIHHGSARPCGPLIVQNCAAIPPDLLESELFGHARGAFTGAHAAREGLFRRAHGGTLFLDEIAELDIRLQAKLLRVLEDGKVRPVGSAEEHLVDFRLVSATSTDMRVAVEQGRMRQDLYYRLNVVIVRIPPLRERTADIPLLIEHFVEKHRGSAGRRPLRFSTEALQHLQSLAWPGNVRELEHLVQRALVFVTGARVEIGDLDQLLEWNDAGHGGAGRPPWDIRLGELETWAIREALDRTGGNRSRAAQLLGIHRNALLRKMSKHGVLPPRK